MTPKIPEAIRLLRVDLGWSRERLAIALAVRYQTISRYERGDMPEIPILRRLAMLANQNGRQDLAAIFLEEMAARLDLSLDGLSAAANIAAA